MGYEGIGAVPAERVGAVGLPDISDLSSRLRFTPREGRIWLDDERMMLLHSGAFAALRQELIDTLGIETARGLFTRWGHVAGSRDADIARRVRAEGADSDILLVGPQLHALEGIVRVEPVTVDVDVERGHFHGEFVWHDSLEGDAHISVYGVGSETACWMQIGYACGYTSTFMGRPILFREVACRAKGDPVCRIVGKPVEEWDDPCTDLRYLEAEHGLLVGKAKGVVAECRQDATVHVQVPGRLGEEVVGASASFTAITHKVAQVAPTDTTVLFLGETGVGKEKFARLLHQSSPRAAGPFIAVNSAALPDNLIEAELFGVAKGAFTGASESRPGKFERANGGTLFLDEVGLLSPAAQAKLPRALQEKEIERVGGTSTIPIDVRVVAATNADLFEDVQARRFRADLYYRLSVFPIRLPPLRERRDDIPVLLRHFLQKFTGRLGKQVTGFTPRAIEMLLDYAYPGNVRELENMVERGVIGARAGNPIDVGHIFLANEVPPERFFSLDGQGRLAAPSDGDETLDALVEETLELGLGLEALETRLLETAVARAGGNVSQAAKTLGLTRAQLAYRLRKRS